MLHFVKLTTNVIDKINHSLSVKELDNIRIKYLGKKGYFSIQMSALHNLPIKERPKIGKIINESKIKIQKALNVRKSELEKNIINARLTKEKIDISLPGRRVENGCLHPITRTINRIESFFRDLGFSIVVGPEIEDDYHNFDALNVPIYHPTRTEHDTFWFDTVRLLRTQTSSVQIRVMKKHTPPIRIISSGRVYRNDYDQTHTPMFHQMEGLVIDENISLTNLKKTLYDFLNNFFEKDLQIRFRPSYFPFTEPSAEIDIMNKNGKWLEILGCGMVHPNVLSNVNIDTNIYSGFAFGIGIERLTMLCYDVTDLRMFFENDLRFLRQFK